MGFSIVAALFFMVSVGTWFGTLSSSLELTAQALEAVDSTVEVVDEGLVVFDETLSGVDSVLVQTEKTLADVATVVLSTAELLNSEIPAQVDSIQAAMDGLIDTANVVDGILGALSFVGVDYDPAVPLDEALVDVNQQLGELGDSLASNADDLFSLTVSVNRLRDEVGATGDSLGAISEQIEESRTLISDYQATAGEAQQLIQEASDRLVGQMWLMRFLGTAILLLLAVAFSALWWSGRAEGEAPPGDEIA